MPKAAVPTGNVFSPSAGREWPFRESVWGTDWRTCGSASGSRGLGKIDLLMIIARCFARCAIKLAPLFFESRAVRSIGLAPRGRADASSEHSAYGHFMRQSQLHYSERACGLACSFRFAPPRF
jgi:hypothetical protein